MPMWLIICLIVIAVIGVLWLLAKAGLFRVIGSIADVAGDIFDVMT